MVGDSGQGLGVCHKVSGARVKEVRFKEAVCRLSFLLPIVNLILADARKEAQAGGRQRGAVIISLRFRIREKKFQYQLDLDSRLRAGFSASVSLVFLICKWG